MHELAITESVVAAVAEHAGDAMVCAVTLEIGRLSGVVADSVQFCFELCTPGTTLEGARLDIIDVLGQAKCRDCGRDLELADTIALCECGSANLAIRGGEQLRIKSYEVEVQTQPAEH